MSEGKEQEKKKQKKKNIKKDTSCMGLGTSAKTVTMRSW